MWISCQWNFVRQKGRPDVDANSVSRKMLQQWQLPSARNILKYSSEADFKPAPFSRSWILWNFYRWLFGQPWWRYVGHSAAVLISWCRICLMAGVKGLQWLCDVSYWVLLLSLLSASPGWGYLSVNSPELLSVSFTLLILSQHDGDDVIVTYC